MGHRLMGKTSAFESENEGSIPSAPTIKLSVSAKVQIIMELMAEVDDEGNPKEPLITKEQAWKTFK